MAPSSLYCQSFNTPSNKQSRHFIFRVLLSWALEGEQVFRTIFTPVFNRRRLTCETYCSSFFRRPEVLRPYLLSQSLSSPGLLLPPGRLPRNHLCRGLPPSRGLVEGQERGARRERSTGRRGNRSVGTGHVSRACCAEPTSSKTHLLSKFDFPS